NQSIHSGELGGGFLLSKNGVMSESFGYSAVEWQLRQELRGLSTGPFKRPFQPRCVGGSSLVSLMTVSLRPWLIIVLTGCGFEASVVFSGSLPHMIPTGIRFSHLLAWLSWPLYWKVPNSQPRGARLSRTAKSI